MPNYCYNGLNIKTNTPKQFTKLIQGITNNSQQPLDFNRVIPVPEELMKTNAPNNDNPKEMIAKYGFADWYDFRCAKWGTKWNACDVDLQLNSPTELTVSFNTAWSPPIPVIDKIAEMFPFASISLHYEEEGMGFYGDYLWEEGNLISHEEGEINCDYRWKQNGECYEDCEECGNCDCECGCEQPTRQTICSDCNENDHQNNNNLPQFTNKEQRGEINE
jgi:hypothetical protein